MSTMKSRSLCKYSKKCSKGKSKWINVSYKKKKIFFEENTYIILDIGLHADGAKDLLTSLHS